MRKLAVIIIALATLAFSGVADAGKVSISGTHSKDEIKATCSREGADYSEDAGGYGCAKRCNGSICGVGCTNNGQCTGQCPKCGQARVTARNFRVLTHRLWQY